MKIRFWIGIYIYTVGIKCFGIENDLRGDGWRKAEKCIFGTSCSATKINLGFGLTWIQSLQQDNIVLWSSDNFLPCSRAGYRPILIILLFYVEGYRQAIAHPFAFAARIPNLRILINPFLYTFVWVLKLTLFF